ncbi:MULTISPECIES: serine kinase/phosphatase [Pseudomonas]|uniref:serine kinase/phosphatase n=1 Tax=Pseudomonas TaxID=286 RepID=UPI0021BFE9A1|nr:MULTISPECIES: serine kinase/phosphatase [Pseudomonas]UXL37902.1 serine kinase/phosphatase [Pseudomonas fragi]
MNDSRRPYGAPQPAPIDDIEDAMGSVEPLNFDDDDTYEPISDLFIDDERVKHRAVLNDELELGLNDDDLEQEMLIREDGARDAKEAAQSPNAAADWDLSLVDEDEIGAGKGLDEAELAEIDPVGRKH